MEHQKDENIEGNLFVDSTSKSFCARCGCEGYKPGDELSLEAATEAMKGLKPGFWTIGDDGKSLRRNFICANFGAAIKFINDVAAVADNPEINHHPDIHLTKYRNIEIIIFTHSVIGLTPSDFILAKELEKIPVEYSEKWRKYHENEI